MKAYFLSLWIMGAAFLPALAQDSPFAKGAKPESAYTFNASMTYKMTTVNRKGKSSSMTTKYYFSPKSTTIGMKMLSSSDNAGGGLDFMVMDISQAKVFTFMESKMVIGMALRQDKVNEMMEKENGAISVTKTAEKKTIMGYDCEGYAVKNDNDKSDILMWVSKKPVESIAGLGEQMARTYMGSGKGAQNNYFAYNAHPELTKMAKEGRAILGYTTKTEKGDVTEMELTEIEPKINYIFKASDYKSMF
ncbi:MAG: DUF4412 domain-containing protein [Leadbetterella sp.]|nr:DUF4412 domain-containing protein [Leadbetterella sp.]